MNDIPKCPDCGSTNLLVGNFPLSCMECGWSYLNTSPCRVCGGKSVSVASGGGDPLYGCVNHPITNREYAQIFSAFYNAINS